MLHQTIRKKSTKIYSGWSFNGDGRFGKERVKGADKRNRSRLERSTMKKETRNEIDSYY